MAKQELGALFGVKFKRAVEFELPVAQADQTVPRLQDHMFDADTVKLLFAWDTGVFPVKNLMLTGPTGSGKSSLIEQYAARMNREVIRVGCHGRMEFQDLVGGQRLVRDGEAVVTAYQDGPLVQAMRRGSILLLDEQNFLSPAVVGGLNGVLDGAPLMNPDTGEVIQPSTGFRIAATGNAVDGGEGSVDFRGTQKQNMALLDRYIALKVDYMDEVTEAKILHKAASNLTGEVITLMLRVAAEVRASFQARAIGVTLSTRVLISWGAMLERFAGNATGEELLGEMRKTLGFALLNRANEQDRYVVEGLLARFWAGGAK